MSKVALITGITGQDGAYLAELLLKKGNGLLGAPQAADEGVCGRARRVVRRALRPRWCTKRASQGRYEDRPA